MKKSLAQILSILLLCSLLFQSTPATARPTDYSITGQVTDGNGNGLAGVTLIAEPYFQIYLPSVQVPGGEPRANQPVQRSILYPKAVTDANGDYSFAALPDGSYRLHPVVDGVAYVPAERPINPATTGSQDFEVLVSEPVIPETTEVLTDESNQYLDPDRTDGVIFTFTQSTPELEQLAIGDIMVGDVNAAQPDGYLRKVTAIEQPGGEVVVTTEPATLEEAIQDGTAYFRHTLDPAEVISSSALPGVTMLPAPGRTDYTFFFNVSDVVLYDEDGDPSTENDQVKANGSVEFDMEFTFYLNIQEAQVEQFALSSQNTLKDTIEIVAETELASLEEESILASQTFTPITIMVGPVPVVFVPKLDIVVGVDGSVSVGISTSVSHELAMLAGVQYQAGFGWSPISDLHSQFSFVPPHATIEAVIQGYFGARFNLYLYGVAGPYVKITPFLEFSVTPLDDPWWTLSAGINVPVGFRVIEWVADILELDEYEVVAVGVKEVLATADNIVRGMIYIPSGEFYMGCDPTHNGGYPCNDWLQNDLPLHAVYLDAYYIDKYEVTNTDYNACVAAGACTDDAASPNRPDDNYPKENVTWYQAQAFCAWGGKQLPTEAQWEKAARGSLIRAYPWGDGEPNCDLGNFMGANPYWAYCHYGAVEVGSHPAGASPYGVQDMAGNVYEWVYDWYDQDYYSDSPYRNPAGPAEGWDKVVRGGSWGFEVQRALVSYRFRHTHDRAFATVGFRCAKPAGN